MDKIEINKTAETTSRKYIDVVYWCSILLCVVAIFIGFKIGADYGFIPGGVIIIVSIVAIISSVLTRAILHTFVNISSRLSIGEELLKKLESIETLMINNNSVSPQEMSVIDEIDAKKIDDNDLDESLIDLINQGKILDARSILIEKKGVSFSDADSYIKMLKNRV